MSPGGITALLLLLLLLYSSLAVLLAELLPWFLSLCVWSVSLVPSSDEWSEDVEDVRAEDDDDDDEEEEEEEVRTEDAGLEAVKAAVSAVSTDSDVSLPASAELGVIFILFTNLLFSFVSVLKIN